MTADEYRRVGHIFDEIRALPESAWRGALDEACAGNADLRAQVIVLLDADRQVSSGGFLERSALEDAAHLLNRNSTQLPSPGTVIGNYRVGQRIGAGGMGVVFEAHDLRLDRRVALKVLPPHIATEKQERLQRFKREARAAALLNHPNMVAIYDAEFEQGWCYIAMEFVEGKTLRQMITAQARPLDPTNVLDVIGQAAAALSAAHQADMVHRDVKPENIMVRDDGFVKLLDFGLAKLREPDSNPENGACLPTRPGNLAGTVHYVSPEQIQGKPAGAGSDLFSLGVVAYELAAGVRPFDGPTDGAVFNAILNTTPPLPSAARPVASRTALAAELDVLIMRLLEKDPELRFQTAQDVRSSCLRLSRAYIAAPPQAAPAAGAPAEMRSQTGRWKPLAAILGLATVLTAALLWLTRPLPMPRVTRIVQITRDGLPKEYFVNDGKRLYYASGNGNTQLRMFQVSARGGDPVPMRLPAGMVPFDISADGSELLLGQFPKESGASLTLWTAATLGGPPRRLGDLRAYDARWSPKGDEIVYCNPPEIRIASSDGSDSRLLTVVKGNDLRYPAWSPDGRLIRFTLDKKNVVSLWQVESDGTHLKELFRESGDYPRQQGVWTPDGKYFLFSAQQVTQDLWAVPQIPRFSLRRGSNLLRLTNGPLIADRPQPTPDGRRIFFRGRLDRGELVRYDEKADRWVPYLDGLAGMQLDYSRDGKWITYASYPDTSIWRCAADGSDRVQLTTPPLICRNPRWSPDDTQIVFYGGPAGKPARLYVVPAAGGAVHLLTHGEAGPNGDEDGNWSPDGTAMVFGPQLGDGNQSLPLRMMEMKSGRVSILPGSEGLWSPRWSPDGRYIAALGFPQPTIWLYNLATHERRQVTTVGESWPIWSRDSRYLYFSNTSSDRLRISDGKVEHVASWNGLRTADGTFGWVGLAPDGSLISTRDAGSTEVYALDWETP